MLTSYITRAIESVLLVMLTSTMKKALMESERGHRHFLDLNTNRAATVNAQN